MNVTSVGSSAFPSLAKEGWPRPSIKMARSNRTRERTGWLGQHPINRWLIEPPRLRAAKVAVASFFLMRASTPPLPRRGKRLPPAFVLHSSINRASEQELLPADDGPSVRA